MSEQSASYRVELTKPYVEAVNYSRVKLLPSELNNDLYANLKNRLIQKVEGKCNKWNYVVKVYDLTIESHGEIEPEDVHCGAVFNVSYNALVCKLMEGMVVVCVIDKISPDFIITANKGFGGIVQMSTINRDHFSFDRPTNKFYYVRDNEPREVVIGDKIVVQIKKINYFSNQRDIMMMGELLRLATAEEVREYHYEETSRAQQLALEFDEQ